MAPITAHRAWSAPRVKLVTAFVAAGILAVPAGPSRIHAQLAHRVVATVSVGRTPYGVGIDSVLGRAYVTNSADDTVSVIDTGTDRVVATVGVGRFPFYHVAVDETRHRVYVTNNGAGTVSVIDGLINVQAAVIPGVIGAPEGVAVHPGLNRVYVTRSGHTMTVIDAATEAVVRDVRTGTYNHTVVVDAGLDRAFVTRSDPNVLTVVDLASHALIDDIRATGHPTIDAARHLVYLADFRSPRAWVVDGAANAVLAEIPLTHQPLLIAVDPERGCLYTTHPGNGLVTVIDLESRLELGTVTVGAEPSGIAVEPASGKVYVANARSGSVSVIKGEPCGYVPPVQSPSPSPITTVTVAPPATATATLPATATATIPATATATIPASATATRTPTPSPTSPGPYFCYLPFEVKGACLRKERAVDVVLLLDVSQSMTTVEGGRTRLDAARNAARALIGLLDPTADRVAVVAFSATPQVVQPLTFDIGSAATAVDRILAGEGTRIDRALDAALTELARPPARASAARAVVLVTDGRTEGGSEAGARAAAAALSASGAQLYAIGLGGDVDAMFLRQLAGSADAYLYAPDADALAALYERVATALPCPSGFAR